MTTEATTGAFAPNSNPSKQSTLKNKEHALLKFGINPNKIIHKDGRYWMTAEQLGIALGYNNPRKGVMKILERHRKELRPFTSVVNLGTEAGMRETTIFNTGGQYRIAFFANTSKAEKFRTFVVGMLEALERQEFIHVSQIDQYCRKDWIHKSEIEQWGKKIGQMKQDLTDLEISMYVRTSLQIDYKQYNKLVRYRNMGLSQREIAKLLDISRSVVRKIASISKKYEGYDYPGKFRPILIESDLDELFANKKPALRNLRGILKGGA